MIDTYNISDLIRYPAAIEDFRKFGINCPDIRILEEAYVEAFDFDSGNTLYLSHHIDGNENDKAFMHLALLEFVKKYEKDFDGSYPPDYIPDLIEAYIGFKDSNSNDELFTILAGKIVFSIITVLDEIYHILKAKSNPYAEICLFVKNTLKKYQKIGE